MVFATDIQNSDCCLVCILSRGTIRGMVIRKVFAPDPLSTHYSVLALPCAQEQTLSVSAGSRSRRGVDRIDATRFAG
jgi:hypothetical protein